jgi:transposase
MSIISDQMGTTLTQSAEKKPCSRTGRPNYPRELRDRLAAAACEPGVSVAKLARGNGINANMLSTWRRRYLADQQARSAGLIPVVLLSDSPTEVMA